MLAELQSEASSEPRRVLIVDDDGDFAQGLRNLLSVEGYEVAQANSAGECQRALECFDAEVALVDVRLGHHNGISLLSELRARRPGILCVMMTAYASVDSAMLALHEGAYDYLRKPFHADDLLATLGRCFERARLARDKSAAEAALRSRNRELERINARLRNVVRSMQTLATCTALDGLCASVLVEIARITSAGGGSVYLKEGDRLILKFALDPGHAAEALTLPLVKGSVFETALRTRRAVLADSVNGDASPKSSGWSGYQNDSLLAFPLLASDQQPIGVLSLHCKRAAPFSAQDRELGQILISFCCETIRVLRALEDSASSRERFRDFAESASDWFWEMDEDLRFSWISARFQSVTGISPDSVMGKTRWEIGRADPDRDEMWLRHREDLKARRPFRDFRYQYPDQNARMRHLNINGVPVFDAGGRFAGYRGTATDLSGEVEAETALRSSEARFRGIVENSPSAIFLKDLDGRFLLVNKRFEAWYGKTTPEVRGKTTYDVFPSSYADAYAAMDREVLDSAAVMERELSVPFSDGTVHAIVVTKFPVLDAGGRPMGVGTINTDVTDRRRAEEQLRQAQKMESLGQLTGGVAHDFNNLLAVILGNLDLIGEGLESGVDLEELVEDARDAARRGADLTHRLLAFGRRQTLHPQVTNLARLVAGMTRMLQRALGETIRIETALAEDLWPTMVDTNQLETSLLNLVINARDAMVNGGSLRIEAANTELARANGGRHEEVSPGSYVMLAVTDNGSGMPPEVVEQAVQPFFTTKSVGRGSGLGLSMVYGFVKQSGGHIEIFSEPGRGTTVKIYLPKAEQEGVQPDSAPPPVQEIRGAGERILVVEDEPEVRKLATRFLSRFGYEVLEAPDGEAALLALQEASRVDLLFTDVVLPGGISGVQLARQARQRIPGLKVLFTSGYAETAILRDGFPDGGARFVDKPFRKEVLARTVRETLDGVEI